MRTATCRHPEGSHEAHHEVPWRAGCSPPRHNTGGAAARCPACSAPAPAGAATPAPAPEIAAKAVPGAVDRDRGATPIERPDRRSVRFRRHEGARSFAVIGPGAAWSLAQQPDGKRFSARPELPGLYRFSGDRHAARTCRLPNGVRINEVFGDVVNWDFIPQKAINQLTLVPQQSGLRSRRDRRCAVLRNEERIHLPRRRGRN